MSETNTENASTGNAEIPKVDKAKYDKTLIDLRSTQTEAENLRAELAQFKKVAGSIDEVVALKTAVATMETKEAGGNPDEIQKLVNKRVDEELKKVAPELEKWKGEALTAKTKLHEVEVVEKALAEVSAKFKPDTLAVIKDLYLSKFVRKDEDGSFYIIDDKGNPEYSGAKKKTLEDFTGYILEKHPSFAASQPSNNSRQAGETKTSKSSGAFDARLYQSLTGHEKAKYLRQFSSYTK